MFALFLTNQLMGSIKCDGQSDKNMPQVTTYIPYADLPAY